MSFTPTFDGRMRAVVFRDGGSASDEVAHAMFRNVVSYAGRQWQYSHVEKGQPVYVPVPSLTAHRPPEFADRTGSPPLRLAIVIALAALLMANLIDLARVAVPPA